jgi:hypothetical protein
MASGSSDRLESPSYGGLLSAVRGLRFVDVCPPDRPESPSYGGLLSAGPRSPFVFVPRFVDGLPPEAGKPVLRPVRPRLHSVPHSLTVCPPDGPESPSRGLPSAIRGLIHLFVPRFVDGLPPDRLESPSYGGLLSAVRGLIRLFVPRFVDGLSAPQTGRKARPQTVPRFVDGLHPGKPVPTAVCRPPSAV